VLDGEVIHNARYGALDEAPNSIWLYTGLVPAGDHVLQFLANLGGDGEGDLSYLRGYRFTVKSSHAFQAPASRRLRLCVRLWEKAGVPMVERPALRYVEIVGR
jgi:hypothetical protein